MKTTFEISKHPDAQGYDREIELIGPFPNFKKKEVSCHVELHHKKDGGIVENYVKSETLTLFTSKDKFVDSSGQIVQKDENGNYPEGSISEFDFLFSYVSPTPNATLGEIILEVVDFIVKRNDVDGNFNDLTNFSIL